MNDGLAHDSMPREWQVRRFGLRYVEAYEAGVLAFRAGLGPSCSLKDKDYAVAYLDGYADAKEGKEW